MLKIGERMKQLFKSELNGTELFKKAVIYLLAYIVCIAGMFKMAMSENWVGYALTLILLVVASFALQYQFISSLINAVSLDDKKFNFEGSFGAFIVVFVKGLLLSMITLGIYSPWFVRNIISFITNNTKYPGKELEFNGKGSKLLVYMLLSLLIPCVVLVALLVPMFIGASSGDPAAIIMAGIVYILGIFFISSLYMYFVYKWAIDYTFGDDDLSLDVSFGKTFLFVLGQMLLTIITFGIYSFAAEVKIFGFFTKNSILTNKTTGEVQKLDFTGSTGSGFGLLLGQTLLCMVTLGIYIPWAFANIQNWFISNVTIGE